MNSKLPTSYIEYIIPILSIWLRCAFPASYPIILSVKLLNSIHTLIVFHAFMPGMLLLPLPKPSPMSTPISHSSRLSSNIISQLSLMGRSDGPCNSLSDRYHTQGTPQLRTDLKYNMSTLNFLSI